MNEWILGNNTTVASKPLEVWLKSGEVRLAIYIPTKFYGLRFLDCTHQLQNVICAMDYIKAWRIASAPAH